MPIYPSYTKLKAADTSIVCTPVERTRSTSTLMKHDVQVAYIKIPCRHDFITESINVQTDPHHKSGTIAFEVLYQYAVGTIKLQESVSGDYWADIYSGTTQAILTLVANENIQSQVLNLSTGAYAGNYIRAVWDGTEDDGGTGEGGWVAVNVA